MALLQFCYAFSAIIDIHEDFSHRHFKKIGHGQRTPHQPTAPSTASPGHEYEVPYFDATEYDLRVSFTHSQNLNDAFHKCHIFS